MNVIFFVVPFLDSQFRVVSGHFVCLVFEVGTESFVDDLPPVLGTHYDTVIAEVYGVGIMKIFAHVSILSRGRGGDGERLHPTGLRPGFYLRE